MSCSPHPYHVTLFKLPEAIELLRI
jgi:hypothetical protein